MKYSVSFGCCTLSIDDEFLVVRLAEPGCLAPSGMVPTLHKGMWADHLSIPLKPMARGPHKGKYNLHLTYEDGAHVSVAIIDPADSQRVGIAIEAGMLEVMRQALSGKIQRIDSAWLTARGYEILFPDPEKYPELMRACFQQGKRHFRVSEKRIEGLVEGIVIDDPTIIDDEDFRSIDLALVKAVHLDGEAPSLHLHYDSKARWGGDPAWYAWPYDWMRQSAEHLMAMISRVLGPRVWECIRTICVEMGLPVDFERLSSMMDPQSGVIDCGDWTEEAYHA